MCQSILRVQRMNLLNPLSRRQLSLPKPVCQRRRNFKTINRVHGPLKGCAFDLTKLRAYRWYCRYVRALSLSLCLSLSGSLPTSGEGGRERESNNTCNTCVDIYIHWMLACKFKEYIHIILHIHIHARRALTPCWELPSLEPGQSLSNICVGKDARPRNFCIHFLCCSPESCRHALFSCTIHCTTLHYVRHMLHVDKSLSWTDYTRTRTRKHTQTQTHTHTRTHTCRFLLAHDSCEVTGKERRGIGGWKRRILHIFDVLCSQATLAPAHSLQTDHASDYHVVKKFRIPKSRRSLSGLEPSNRSSPQRGLGRSWGAMKCSLHLNLADADREPAFVR